MKLSERLVKQNKQNSTDTAFFDEEETMMYKNVSKRVALNSESQVFQNNHMTGINTEENIFEKTTVFKTQEGRK